ncbi:MAG: sporulation protein YqfD [Ruminococcus sp.]|nr:sporulation protein YqfD [Ruminococcus sp.]MDE6797273.1 sporulation protein YqfD [Ruminococcus sp.]
MKNQIKGCVRINASGKNLYKFINALHDSDVDCFAQYCRNDVFYAEIYRRDLKEVQEIAENLNIDLTSFEYDTISSTVIRHKKRFGIIAGIIFVTAISLYFSGIIMTIEIQGNSKVSDSTIITALEQLNIKQGTPIKDINFPYCENELRLMIDDVAWAGMHITGNRVVVEVTEIVEKPEMINDRIPCNVVSSQDAYITYTSIYDGQLMHKVGDYVPRGTMLINGVTKDETGHVNLHHAMGKIIGTYEETVTFEGSYKSRQYNPTGETFSQKTLKLFSFEIPVSFGKNKFTNFTTEENEKYLKVLGKTIPVGIVKNRYTETELSETTYTEEELSEKIMEKIYLYEKNFLDDDIKILERDIKTEKKEDSLEYIVTYKLEGDICEQKEILIK